MNKAEWTDYYLYNNSLFVFEKSKKLESILDSSKNHNNYREKDEYKKSKRKNFYGKKRRNYSDYC